MAPFYVPMGLVGFGLIASAPTPNLSPVTLGFLSIAADLLLSGVTELMVGVRPGLERLCVWRGSCSVPWAYYGSRVCGCSLGGRARFGTL